MPSSTETFQIRLEQGDTEARGSNHRYRVSREKWQACDDYRKVNGPQRQIARRTRIRSSRNPVKPTIIEPALVYFVRFCLALRNSSVFREKIDHFSTRFLRKCLTYL